MGGSRWAGREARDVSRGIESVLLVRVCDCDLCAVCCVLAATLRPQRPARSCAMHASCVCLRGVNHGGRSITFVGSGSMRAVRAART